MKNKSIFKGAAAIAVGGALLLGGGGTLAWWNAADTATPGTIASGDLNVVAGDGVWKDRLGNVISDIGSYHVVPGDKLTYSQNLKVTLVGDRMAAKLTAARTRNFGGFDATTVDVSAPTLSLPSSQDPLVVGTVLPALTPVPVDGVDGNVYALERSGEFTASMTFEFLSSVIGRTDVNEVLNLDTVSFTLQQVEKVDTVSQP